MDEICVNIRSNRFFESEEIVLIQINGLQEMEQLGLLLGQTAQGGNVLQSIDLNQDDFLTFKKTI